MEFSSVPKVCYILGIDQRSGTNFIYRLLSEHPSCAGPGPIWEDEFLKHSKLISDYTHNLYSSWKSSWEVEKKIGGQETLLRYFGNAIENFLRLQLTKDFVNQTASEQSMAERQKTKILLTKTPTVEGLDNFFNLFPESYLILLVRDGRAVVESGVKSFDWNYESAMRRWRTRAEAILCFKEKHENSNKKFLILKYEDLVTNEKNTLLKIFDFLDIDPELFDFNSAKSLGVTGSSELKDQTSGIHWQVMEKKMDFNPLARFSNWDRKRHERFNWIAGKQMTRLGYELVVFSENKQFSVIRNKFRDLIETPKTFGVRTVRKALRVLKRLLENLREQTVDVK